MKNFKERKKKRGKESRDEGRKKGKERRRFIAHCCHKWKGRETISGDNLSGTFLHINNSPNTIISFWTCLFFSCSLLAELELSSRKAPAEGGQKGCKAANFSISPLGLFFHLTVCPDSEREGENIQREMASATFPLWPNHITTKAWYQRVHERKAWPFKTGLFQTLVQFCPMNFGLAQREAFGAVVEQTSWQPQRHWIL